MKLDNASCIWWDVTSSKWDLNRARLPNPASEDRFYRFESAVFEHFDPAPPPRQLMLHGSHDFYAFTRGESIPTVEQCPPRNNDQEDIVRILDWQPWPLLAGQRIERVQGEYTVFMSCAAKIYYLPAMMLNSLWQRTSFGMDPIEMFIPPRDPEMISAFSDTRSSDGVPDQQTWATEQLRSSLNVRQLEVVREYLALCLTWQAFHRKTEPIDFNAVSVKEKIREIERFIAWWDPD